MSADAQPRKRKDKKKKRDERELLNEKVPVPPPPTMTPPSTPVSNPSSDEVMHIYKEGKVGGSAWTKLLFFGIMTGLAVTISIVMMSSPIRDVESQTASKDEGGTVESLWSLDLGLGEWSPFSFGPDEGHEETHSESPGQGEEHEDEKEEHGEEHDEHEHSHEEQDEGGIMSWLGWGGGVSSGEHEAGAGEEEHASEEHIEEPGGEGLSSWFGWGGGEESTIEEAAEETSSSSWFGWGLTEPSFAEQAADEPIDEPSGEVITKPSSKSKSKETVESQEEEEDKTDEQENKEDDDDDVPQEADNDDDDDDDDDELATFLRSLDLDPNLKRDSRAHIEKDRAREQSREERERQVHLREIRAREDRAREERLRENRVRENRAHEERLREMRVREEQAQMERAERELRSKEERIREQRAREERAREERAREEKVREERARLELFEEEARRAGSQEQDQDLEEEEDEIVAVSRKKVVIVEDDDELFPEAAEALRLEQSAGAKVAEANIVESQADDTLEEAPFSRDDPEEDLAQGVAEQGEGDSRGKVEKYEEPVVQLTQASVPPHQPSPEEEEKERVEEKVMERKTKPSDGSVAAKASEFLAERAAERATRETQVPMREQPPLNFPPPPSFSPEPSDEEEEEELSDPEPGYSAGEDILDDEESDDNGRLEGDQDLGDSPFGSDVELNLEDSEPELEDEEEEEEEEVSDDETPAPAVVKKTPTSAPPSKERTSGPQNYEHEDITDDYDWAIKEELDLADEEFRRNPSGCLHMYQALQAKHDNSARARVGVAKCLDSLSKEASSNRLLEFAIYSYRRALKLPLKDKLFLETAQTLVARLRFRGFVDQTLAVHKMIITRFRDDPKHRNDLAISYLMINNLKEAEKVLNETLVGWPGDAVARTHYGLTLKLQA